jgi:mannosyltransferase OCH1-like enzyme
MNVTRNNNSKATIMIADDIFMQDFIISKYNKSILHLYNLIRIPASKADLARLLLLYEYGGFYLDVSMELRGAIIELVDTQTNLLLVKRDDNPRYKNDKENAHVINGIIGVEPRSIFIQWCIQRIFRNLINDDLNKSINIATGPRVLNQALPHFEKKLTIQKLSFSYLQENFLSYRRVAGISNEWIKQQHCGNIDPEYYRANAKGYEKIWLFKNRFFHLSFKMLLLK